ncbi:MAG TPA: histidine utilization repressor [Caulobacteraceae bacterium]|jgi:GntR family histidine utilization transcriptional repressor|nr:histidine utilization repressor [Caulobacteraceae bacterium]
MSSLESRIRSDLEGKIRSGEWPPGARIPTEHELVAQYGCARMTVHKAITALAAGGLIERRKKAGSFVARPHVQTAVIEIPDIAAVIAARGEAYRFDLLQRARGPAATLDEASTVAGFDLGDEVLVLDGLHVAAGRPFCREHRLIDLAAAPEAAETDFSTIAPGSWLLGHIPWTQARHRITACSAGPGAELLQIGRNTACLRVERWTWRASQPVTFVRQLFPGDRYDLVAEFTPD